jgi:hypothetical protein
MKVCSITDCTRPSKSRGWCNTHYERWRRHGDAERELTFPDRFWAKVDKSAPNGCWEWTGARTSVGYGHVWNGERFQQAHRAAYELEVGPIPEGLQVDHLCFNIICVNPVHLEPVTAEENNRRSNSLSAKRMRQTACIRGHDLKTGSNGKRYCPTCRSEQRQVRAAVAS